MDILSLTMTERLETFCCNKCYTVWKAKPGPQSYFKGKDAHGELIIHACPAKKCNSQYCTWVTYDDFRNYSLLFDNISKSCIMFCTGDFNA